MTAKHILSFLLSLMFVILFSACTNSKPLSEPIAIIIEPVSGNISTTTLSLAMNITFDAPYVGVMLKFQILEGTSVIKTFDTDKNPLPVPNSSLNAIARIETNISLTNANNGKKSYSARISWNSPSEGKVKELLSSPIDVNVAIP
jgi:type IV secretory pathway VirB2 component (pilin)